MTIGPFFSLFRARYSSRVVRELSVTVASSGFSFPFPLSTSVSVFDASPLVLPVDELVAPELLLLTRNERRYTVAAKAGFLPSPLVSSVAVKAR